MSMTYNRQHRFYCGVDLHARSMYVHVLDGVSSCKVGGKSVTLVRV
jgi:hypothetical protein